MKVLTTTAVLVFLATSLSAQGPATGANTAKTGLSRKEAKHLRKVKKQALQFGDWDRVCVRLTDHSQVEGQLVNVTNEGIQIGIWTTKPGSPQDHSSRFIQFRQIRTIKVSDADSYPHYTMGAMAGLFGPLGWWVEWLAATGRIQD